MAPGSEFFNSTAPSEDRFKQIDEDIASANPSSEGIFKNPGLGMFHMKIAFSSPTETIDF